MAPSMPSSTIFGSRLRRATICSYSVGRSPKARSVVGSASTYKGLKEEASVGTAEKGFVGALGVRHQAEDVARGVGQAGDGALGTVWIGSRGEVALGVAVAQCDPCRLFNRHV